MKRLTQIFQALLGVAALILTAIIAFGRLTWCTMRNRWNRCSKWFRRSMAAILVVIPVAIVVLVTYAFYDSKYGRLYWGNRTLSNNVEVHAYRDCTYRIYNIATGEYTTQKINWLSDAAENDSLVVYALPNRRGYININSGEVVVDAESNDYRKAWVFSEGLAAVMKDDKIGFINSKNEVVIPFEFDYSNICHIWDVGYVFHNGYCIMTNKDGSVGLIDSAGRWVIEPSYDEIWAPHESGFRVLVKDGEYGVIDNECNTVYSTEFDYVDIISDGFIFTKGGKKWQVDFEGNIINSFIFDGTYYLNYPIGYNENGDIKYAFADYLKYEVMNRYGIMNRLTGEPVTPALYSDINMLSKELFEVQDPENSSWFLMDVNGNVLEKQ